MVDYTLEYYYQYYDIGGTLHRVELLLLEYSGGSTAIEDADPTPVRIRHTGSKVDFEKTIIQGQELIFSFYVPRADADTWDSLFESDYKDYKVRYYVGGNLEFEGYVKPENLSKQYSKNPPYMRITLSATDALADLKNIDFGDGEIITDRLIGLEIIKHALTPIGINLDFQVQLGTYESNFMVSTECALEEIKMDTRRFFEWKTGRRKNMSCWDVIEAVLKDFNVKFKQYKGQYQITCHHELNSRDFLYDWATLTASSASPEAVTNVIDISTYKYDPDIDQQKIRPLKNVEITFKNKDLGGDATSGLDLDDWGNDPPWDIDFSNGFAVVAGVVELKSDDNTYDEYIETVSFNVAKSSDYDYLKITFDHIVNEYTYDHMFEAPQITIEITRPDATVKRVFFDIDQYWQSYESPIHEALKIISTGNYSIRLSFNAIAPSWSTISFKLKEFRIAKVINSEEGGTLEAVTYDKYYRQTSNIGIEIFEVVTLFADAAGTTEVGALLYEDSVWNNTSLWRSYGNTEDIKLLDIYARYILDNRYDYKNYLRARISDRDNNIGFDNVLTIESKNYVFISYDRDFRAGFITAELVEFLTTRHSGAYNDIFETNLNSIDGESASTSVNVTHMTAEAIPSHNELEGLQGGQAVQYYHLTAAQHTNVGNLDTMAYEAVADYYTAAQVDIWRSNVSQTEMSYLDGVTSDIQTQLTARVIIGANPADNRIATWTNATTLQGEANLTFDGSELVNKTALYKQYSTEGGKTDWRLTIDTEDADLAKIYNYDEGETAFRNMVLGSSSLLLLDLANTRVDITGANSAYNQYWRNADTEILARMYMGATGSVLDLLNDNGGTIGIKLDTEGDSYFGGGGVKHPSFVSGWAGVNWRIEADGDAEFRNVRITGGLQVWELIINRLHYQCGGLIVGAGGGKISEVIDNTLGSEIVAFEDPEGNDIIPFTVGAIVMIQDFDLNRIAVIKKIVREVDAINSDFSIDLMETAGWVAADDDTGVIAVGDEIVAVGHVSDAGLDASLYMSAVDSDNPFLRILDGVDSWAKFSLGDKSTIKVQIGNLESIAEHDIVPAAPGFGLYSDNVYLSGKIVATSGEIGGWTIDSEAIYSNDKHAGDDWADESDPGTTFMDDGSIHCPNFYVNTGGEIGLRQVEHVLFKQDGNSMGIKVAGAHIWENELDNDAGAIRINHYGYDGADTRFRDFYVSDGKTAVMMFFDGSADNIKVYATTEYYNDIKIDSADGFAARFFNDGNNINRHGIKIQCGMDAPDGNDNLPIVFYDGDGGVHAHIRYDDTTIGFSAVSDAKLKENVKDYDINGLDIISQMRYRSFNWIKDMKKAEVHNWIADEVEQFFPEMVSVNPISGYKMISESKLIPIMVGAIKELNERIKVLES